jgi:hypothetical protein
MNYVEDSAAGTLTDVLRRCTVNQCTGNMAVVAIGVG